MWGLNGAGPPNPQDLRSYRVFSRKKFALIMAVIMGVVAVGVWIGLDHLAAYARELDELVVADPEKGAEIVRQQLRRLAILNGMFLTALAGLIIRHGSRGLQTASMPPKGSWVLEGQRIWTGLPATRIARFTIAVGAILLVLALASSLVLWRIAEEMFG